MIGSKTAGLHGGKKTPLEWSGVRKGGSSVLSP